MDAEPLRAQDAWAHAYAIPDGIVCTTVQGSMAKAFGVEPTVSHMAAELIWCLLRLFVAQLIGVSLLGDCLVGDAS